MKKILLVGMVLTGFASIAQKEVVCKYTSPATKKEFKVSHVLQGDVYYEGVVSNNAGMTESIYAKFDGTNIIMAKYTINKKDNSCFSIYEYTIPKKSVNWSFNDMFSSASKKSTGADGVVEVTLGGGAFGGNIAKQKVIMPTYDYNYVKDVKTALGKFQNEEKFKEFFRLVTAK
jgi:hypothetical protein